MTRKPRPTTSRPSAGIAPSHDVQPLSRMRKGARARSHDVAIPLAAADERSHAAPAEVGTEQRKEIAPRESLTEQRLEHIPGESGPEVARHLDRMAPSGPMAKDAVHQTESKIHHPLGKTRNGVPQRSDK